MDKRKLALQKIIDVIGPDQFLDLATPKFIRSQVEPDSQSVWLDTRLELIYEQLKNQAEQKEDNNEQPSN